MRDLSNQEKHESSKLGKQVEALTSEVKTLRKDKERLSAEVTTLQEQQIDLQEQVRGQQGTISLLFHGIMLHRKTMCTYAHGKNVQS